MALFDIILFSKISFAEATEISPLIGVGQEQFSFGITDIGQQKANLTYNPNMAGVSRLGLNAYGLSLGYSFRGTTKDLDTAKGTTDFYDLQLGYQTKKWGVDLFYQTYTGFYTQTSVLQVFPNLQFQHFGIMTRFALDEGEFSVGGLVDQSENITRTSGQYFIVGGLRQHRMQNNGTLLPADYLNINPELEDLRKLKATSINLGLGAGKYWVSDSHLFIGALLDLVGTYAIYTYENTSTETNSSYATLSYNIKIGLGYSGQTFKTGVSISTDLTTLKSPGASYFQTSASRGLLYVRFVF